MSETKVSKLKSALATVGAGFCVLAAILVAMAIINKPETGPTSLTLHPEKQEEIISERRARELQSRLGLTEEQIPAVTQIVIDIRAQLRAMREASSGRSRDMFQLRTALMEEFDTRLAALLTEEQRARFDAVQADRSARIGKGMDLRQRFLGWITQ